MKANRPQLDGEREQCLKFEADLKRIGHSKVAKALEFGNYLNALFERHFTRGGAYWKPWFQRLLNRSDVACFVAAARMESFKPDGECDTGWLAQVIFGRGVSVGSFRREFSGMGAIWRPST